MSEPEVDPALLHDGIGRVPGFNFAVHRYVSLASGAEPDVVIAFPVPYKSAAVLCENITDGALIRGH
jgi:hypothetical protein